MKKDEYDSIRYAAGRAYNALKEKDYSTTYVYLWILNYRLGLIEASKEKFGT